jgi:DNA-binding NtrC family response regulator
VKKLAVEMLRQMPWTGNIRELRNVIERLVVLSGTKITPNDVELYC